MKQILTFFRMLHTGFVLARHDALVPAEYAGAVPLPVRMLGWISRLFALRGRAENPGERFANALERLGPAYIKFGQIISTRADIIDPVFAQGLARLKDKVPPFSMKEARARIAAEYGRPWAEIFSEFSEPIAAASVAQVHRATLKSGEVVAVKLLRPNIHRRMARDMATLKMVAWLAEFFAPDLRRLGPKKFAQTANRAVSLELDLRLEAAAASELGEIAADTDLFRVPAIHWPLSAKSAMVMEWIDGTPLSADAILNNDKFDRQALAVRVIQGFLTSAFDYGVFHADMHEGNMVADKNGQLILLDFGILGRLSPREQRFHAEIIYGFLQRDYHRIAEIHFEAGYVPGHHTVEDFASALRAVGEPIFGKTSDQVSMSKILLHLFEITDIFDMEMQPQLIMLQKTMMQAEGVARRLDPEFDMWAAARPVVEDSMRRELGPGARIGDMMADLRKARDTLQTLPGAVDDIAALARAWQAGEIDLSKPPAPARRTNGVGKAFAWSALGAILAGIGFWAFGA